MVIIMMVIFSVVLWYVGAFALVGSLWAQIAFPIIWIAFAFIDWENMPWMKLRWKN